MSRKVNRAEHASKVRLTYSAVTLRQRVLCCRTGRQKPFVFLGLKQVIVKYKAYTQAKRRPTSKQTLLRTMATSRSAWPGA